MNNKEFIADLANRTKLGSREVGSLVNATVSAITDTKFSKSQWKFQ